MPTDLPAGYLTRPEAARRYNRSQRALERDLNVALTIHDEESLSHWKLVTHDGKVRDGAAVTVEIVKDLVNDGMTPAWCIAEWYLEQKYGRKGEPRPAVREEMLQHVSADSERRPESDRKAAASEQFPNDAAFLKELVRTMQSEKQEERERHDRIVAKLFGELDVKNRQISAWDEVTQGLTKALATGQIAPNVEFLLPRGQKTGPTAIQDVAVVQGDRNKAATNAEAIRTQHPPSKSNRGTETAPRKAKQKPTTNTHRDRAEKRPEKQREPRKAKWNEFPTFRKFFSRGR